MKLFSAALAVSGFMLVSTGLASAQDANKGKSVFNQCKACHMLDSVLVGPPLKGVVGRKAGSVAGYSYSPLMKAAGDAGLTWDETNLVDYLKNPTEYLTNFVKGKGKTAEGSSKMVFMLANENQRKNVIAYLAQQK